MLKDLNRQISFHIIFIMTGCNFPEYTFNTRIQSLNNQILLLEAIAKRHNTKIGPSCNNPN